MAAATLATLVAVVYAWRWWEARRTAREAPAPVPVTVQKRSETFSFSKVEGDRTLYTVRASQATEFREGGKSLLQDVWITIYGRQGQRFDNIHTRECDYLAAEGRVICAGEVSIDLESAEEARAEPGARAIRIRTAHITFDRESGEAWTERPVEFQFSYGSGRGVGVRYSTTRAVVRLEREVQVLLASRQPDGPPLQLTGSALEYHRHTQTMRLLGPVLARQGLSELSAAAMTLEFDSAMRAQRLVADGADGPTRPQLRWSEADVREQQLTATQFVARFSSGGHVTQIAALGEVSGTARHGARQDKLQAEKAVVEMGPGSQPRTLEASGTVRIESQFGPRAQKLETEALRFDFHGGRGRAARHAETLAHALLGLRDAGEVTTLRAARLAADFGPRNRLEKLRGAGGVEIERRIGSGPEQRTTSETFSLSFGRGGEWTRAEQSGRVRFREGPRTAEAERARMVRATALLTLEGSANVTDAGARTTAQSIELNQQTGEAVATGNVRTSYRGAGESGSSAFNFAAEPAHISADGLRASRDAGRALYTGRVRLWQGDAVIESDRMELVRQGQQVLAQGNVRGVFPQASAANPGIGNVAASEKDLVRFSAARLTFTGADGHARLEERVTTESQAARISARSLDLFFSARGGVPQVARAEAHGTCIVRQGNRRGAAERCDYDAADGKFVLSGGQPTLSDTVFGTTTGRQLTFFLADDKILVESEEGSRTVTRHRVEK
jgi:lipopolysaccharide export system protein LptA